MLFNKSWGEERNGRTRDLIEFWFKSQRTKNTKLKVLNEKTQVKTVFREKDRNGRMRESAGNSENIKADFQCGRLQMGRIKMV